MTRNMLPLLVVLVACFALLESSPAIAQPTISYGIPDGMGGRIILLLPNTPNQVVLFSVSNLVGVTALEFDLQIGDGGIALGGTDTGPTLGDIDLITATIFDPHGGVQQDVVNTPLAKQSTVDTATLVTSDGLIGSVMFDTTGFFSGDYQFLLTGVAGSFNTRFLNGINPLVTNAPNGRIVITNVPEPALCSSAMGLFGFSGLVLMRRRNR